MQLVKKILSAEYSILKSNPVQLGINGIEETPGRGWKNGQLIPRHHATSPEDGIQDFDFYGEQIDGNECSKAGIISVVQVCDVQPWMIGFRIHTANEMPFEMQFSHYEKVMIATDTWHANIWATVDIRKLLQHFQRKWSLFIQ